MRYLRSVYAKNFITIVLVFCLSLLILGAAFAGMSYSFILRQRADAMTDSAGTTGEMLRSYAQQWGTGYEGINMRATISWLASIAGYHIIITDEQGSIVNCSDRNLNCGHAGLTVPASAISAINAGGKFQGITNLGGVFSVPRFAVGVPLPAGPSRGYIFVSDEAGRMSGIWRGFARIFIFAAIVVVPLSFIMAYAVIRKQSKPIKEMSDAARSYSRGDFSPRVHTEGRQDEVGELAEAFNAMADSLERSEQSRRDLIANVSHELKTPMTTISGFADGILDGTIPKEKEGEYLTVISSETKRPPRRSFDLLEVVCQSLLSLESKITSRGLDVETVLPEEPVYAVGDGDAITQVVHNLLDNAAKFAEPGTAIILKLWREEGRCYVSVANRCETIPKEELPLIFERFHKTDKSRSRDRDGVGLGLYIVKTILDSHGGSIYVTSRDGLTTFTFSLKLAKQRPQQEKNGSKP